jgi:hypothetical protein
MGKIMTHYACTDPNSQVRDTCNFTYSLAHISRQRGGLKKHLLAELIRMCELECDMQLSMSERFCPLHMLEHMCKSELLVTDGVQILTLQHYHDMRWLVSACAQYVNIQTLPSLAYPLLPVTLVECGLLGNYTSIAPVSYVS